MESKEKKFMSVDYGRSIKHYFDNIKMLLGDPESEIKELSFDEVAQVTTDIRSLEDNLKLSGRTLEDFGIDSIVYRKLKEKREVNREMLETSKAA